MTKSTITREESVQAVFDLKVGYRLGFADIEILKRVARMALAAMDSEPYSEITLRLTRLDVLETILRNELGLPCESPIPDIAEKIYDMKRSRIYSVVPEEWTIADAVKFCRETGRQDAGAAMDAWNACRAAMLQAGPVTTANKLGNSPVIRDGSEHCPCCGKKLRRACSVEGCEGKHVAHGLCKKHYDMKRWEDPEHVRKFREAGKRYRRKTKSAAAAPQEVKGE